MVIYWLMGEKLQYHLILLKDGDVIEVKEKSKEVPIVLEAISSTERDIPEYLSVDFDKMKGTFLKDLNQTRFHIQ